MGRLLLPDLEEHLVLEAVVYPQAVSDWRECGVLLRNPLMDCRKERSFGTRD
jgi:hypothetical protein